MEIPVFSQKNDLVLAELLQEKFDLNRHIIDISTHMVKKRRL